MSDSLSFATSLFSSIQFDSLFTIFLILCIVNVNVRFVHTKVSGLLFTIGGFVCGVMSVPFDHFKFAHGAIGLLVFIIGLLQALNGALYVFILFIT